MDATIKNQTLLMKSISYGDQRVIAVSRIKLRRTGSCLLSGVGALLCVIQRVYHPEYCADLQMNRIISRLGIILGAAAALFTIYTDQAAEKVQTLHRYIAAVCLDIFVSVYGMVN
jgi:hypothetical protein